MLEELDLIDWGKLRHAYGPATDVPGLLRDLASTDAGVRDTAMYELCGNIHHQSDVYEASAYAVPFLVELLTYPTVQDKSSILALLEALANGYNYLSFRKYPDPYERRLAPAEWERRQQCERAWTAASHQAVLDYMPVYLQRLDDEEAEVRQMAAFVLSACFERIAEITPTLQQQLLIDSDPAAQSIMIMALTRLWKLANRWGVSQPLSHTQITAFLSDLVERAGLSPLARFVLILALVDLGDHAMRDRLFAAFAKDGEQCLDEFERLRSLWEEDSSLIGAISRTLADQPDIRQQWLIQLLNHPNAAVRSNAVNAIAEVCYTRRSAPAIFAPHLVQIVEQRLHSTTWQVQDCQSALIALGQLGPAAQVALPLLGQALNHRSPDICVWGAYALWQIDQNVANTLPVLLEAIHDQYWPWATLMAVETLGEMGQYAQAALPKLQEFVDAEVRPRDVTLGPFIDGDEILQLVAQQTVTQIEADLAHHDR